MRDPRLHSRTARRSPRLLAVVALLAATALALPRSASAEVNEVRLARQYGISHLAMAIMDELQLVQKHTASAGLGDVKVT